MSHRSARFWAVIRSGPKVYFAYGRAFIDQTATPRVGWQVEFQPLPKASPRMLRATEIKCIKVPRHEAARRGSLCPAGGPK